VVLGAGPGGEVAAGRLAREGIAVAIVEQRLVGGECSYYACTPSKGLLRPAQALAEARRVPGAAQAFTGELDAEAALRWRDELVRDLDDSAQLPWLRERGVELVRGEGVIEGERCVRVGDELLRARRAVIVATGSSASIPPVEGLADAAPWTNREATIAQTVPARLVVLGGGVVGVELAQAWRTLGSEVAMIEPGDRLIGREEAFAAEELERALREDGVDVHLNARAKRVARDVDGGDVTVTLESGEELAGDELLVAAGRTPNTSAIGLERVGLEPGRPIAVDAQLRARVEGDWLYAIGDCNGISLLTHEAKYQGRIVADHLLGRPGSSVARAGQPAPRVIFTEPQIAAVGHTFASARDAGIRARAIDAELNDVPGARYVGRDVPGRCRLVVDEDRDVLAGATFTGADAAEFVHAATIALVGEVPLERLRHAVPSFPTRSEVWLELLEGWEQGPAAS
jgi:pyruvate/2-oxoglutarate dehydrogenase complex dihydrolipoamide dehydrogenase (E3) component